MQGHETQIATLFVAVAVAAWLPSLLPWLALPAPVLELALGILIGPHGLQLDGNGPVISLFSTLGMAVLFMRAGFEVEPEIVRGQALRLAWQGWLGSAALAVAAAAGLVLVGGFPPASWPWLALALATTALGVVQPLLRDRGALPAGYAQVLVASAGFGEVMPTILLSLVVARADRIADQVLMILGFSGGCALLLWLAIRHRHRWEAFLERTMHDSSQLPIRLTMGLLVLMVVIGNLVQINLVLGALVTGVLLRYGTSERHRQALADRLDGLGSGFLIPLFFINSGMRLDFSALATDPLAVLWIPVVALLMLLVRGIPMAALARSALPARARWALALDCGTQLPLVVAIAMLALQRQVLSAAESTALVAGAMATVMLFPALAARLLRPNQA
jgi:CPA2 family monovalent cation:H+ antiporter-2